MKLQGLVNVSTFRTTLAGESLGQMLIVHAGASTALWGYATFNSSVAVVFVLMAVWVLLLVTGRISASPATLLLTLGQLVLAMSLAGSELVQPLALSRSPFSPLAFVIMLGALAGAHLFDFQVRRAK